MTTFIYARVSTLDQSTDVQEDILTKAYPEGVLRSEQASATTMERPMLQLILDMVGVGDTVVVLKLDRLARNMRDLLKIVDTLKNRGAALKVHDQAIDTSTASGNAFMMMLGVFAEFEHALRMERQMAGIAKAKAEGRALGRPATTNTEAIEGDLKLGYSLSQIAERNNCSKSTVQRIKRKSKL